MGFLMKPPRSCCPVIKLTGVLFSCKNTKHVLMASTTSGYGIRTPRQLPLSWLGLFSSSTWHKTLSFHQGLRLGDQSIQASIVVRLVIAKVMGSQALSPFAIAEALISQPTCFATCAICVQQNGVSQLAFLAGLPTVFFFFLPCGFRIFSFSLDWICCAGHVNSAMLLLIFLMLSSVVSASSNITACERVFSRHSQLLVIYPLVSSLYHLDCVVR